MTKDELILRRLAAQYLTTPAPDSFTAASGLCGLQAQFLRNAVHALRIRTDRVSLDGLVKTWTLRGTVHLIPEGDLPLYLRRCGTPDDVCESGWYRWVEARGHALSSPERERWLARLACAEIAGGNDTREGIRAALRSAGMTDGEEQHAFNGWGGLISELAGLGVIAFWVELADAYRPREEKTYRLLAPFEPMPEETARLEMMRRYVTHYGPVTLRDAAYFFHWTQAECRSLLAQLPVQEERWERKAYFSMPEQEKIWHDLPPVRLLAGFDPMMLGYRKEDNPCLPQEHLRGIFNLAGIVNPAILLHGRVAGKWKEKDGTVTLTLFESCDSRGRQLICQEAERLFCVKKMIWV